MHRGLNVQHLDQEGSSPNTMGLDLILAVACVNPWCGWELLTLPPSVSCRNVLDVRLLAGWCSTFISLPCCSISLFVLLVLSLASDSHLLPSSLLWCSAPLRLVCGRGTSLLQGNYGALVVCGSSCHGVLSQLGTSFPSSWEIHTAISGHTFTSFLHEPQTGFTVATQFYCL